jgi:hypothetical protein
MSYRDGDDAVQSISRKQKLNTRSSTESELVGVNDVSVMILWTKLFLEEQGYNINSNILYQDNKSAILLETNGKKSSGKRTRASLIKSRKETLQLYIVRPMTWLEIFVPSPYKGRSSKNSKTQFSDAIINRNGIQRYKTRNANTGSKKREHKKKDTCKLHAKVVVIEHQMNKKRKDHNI